MIGPRASGFGPRAAGQRTLDGVPRAALTFGFIPLLLLSPAIARGAPPQPLPYIEIVTGGARADDQLPLIVALHGRGDTAEGFAPLFSQLRARARVAILRPPHAWGGGQAWFLSTGSAAHLPK